MATSECDRDALLALAEEMLRWRVHERSGSETELFIESAAERICEACGAAS